MRHLRSFRLLALCAVLIGLLGASCSDDGDDASDTTETTAEMGEDSPDTSGDSSTTTGDQPDATESAEPSEPAEGDQEVAIANYTFEPEAVTVKVGSMVTWTNEDDFDHTATSTDGPTEFDTDEFGTGLSSGVTFDEPGTYEYQCDIHTYMTGTIEVVE